MQVAPGSLHVVHASYFVHHIELIVPSYEQCNQLLIQCQVRLSSFIVIMSYNASLFLIQCLIKWQQALLQGIDSSLRQVGQVELQQDIGNMHLKFAYVILLYYSYNADIFAHLPMYYCAVQSVV